MKTLGAQNYCTFSGFLFFDHTGARADITLDNAGNNFVGPFNANGKNIKVVDGTGELNLGNITATDDLSASASGNITQGNGAVISIAGKGSIDSTGGVVTLAPSGNTFTSGLTIIDNTSRAAEKAAADAIVAARNAVQPPASVPQLVLPIAANSPPPLGGVGVAATGNTSVQFGGSAGGSASGSSSSSSSSAGGSIAAGTSAGLSLDVLRTPTNAGLGLIAVSVPKGTSTAGAGFSFPLPAQVMDSAAPNATIQVALADGSPLPAWLSMNKEQTGFIASAVPDGAFPVEVVVTIGNKRSTIVISERNE